MVLRALLAEWLRARIWRRRPAMAVMAVFLQLGVVTHGGAGPGWGWTHAASPSVELESCAIRPLSRGERTWEITSSRCYLASYVSRSLPASAGGTLPVADFGSNSATFGPVFSPLFRRKQFSLLPSCQKVVRRLTLVVRRTW